MPGGPGGLSQEALVRWIEDSLATGSNRLASGYQGQTLLYADPSGSRFVIKVPAGRGLRRWISTLMLRHEARVYARLQGFSSAPQCLGLLARRYLVLEFIEGVSARSAEFENRTTFFDALLKQIQDLHARGIAHSDLQKKDNLLVVHGRYPMLLDFGTAVVRKPGFAPLNHLHFRLARQLDLNQYIKLKYRKRPEDMSDADRALFRRTVAEELARALKRLWRWARYGGPKRRHRPKSRKTITK